MKPDNRFWLSLLGQLFLVARLCQAAEPRVAYTLHAYAPGTSTPVESVKAGQEFDLAMVVQDKRPEGVIRGVFAAYANVNFASRYATVKHVSYTPPFVNGKNCGIVDAGLREWGAFRGLGKGDTEPIEVSRVRLVAKFPDGVVGGVATASFRPNVLNMAKPRFDSLLYGDLRANPPDYGTVKADEIEAKGVSVRILK